MDTKTKNLLKAIDKFNAEYAEYVNTTGETQLPIIDCTIIGFDEFETYTYKEFKTFVRVDVDGLIYKVKNEFDVEEVREDLKYNRRRLKKGWRVWYSENPDAELEKDEEEE